MPKLTRKKLESILSTHLDLNAPIYRLTADGGKISGSIISASFRGMRDSARQRQIWDVLETELGPEAPRVIGMLLAYTPEEWNAGVDAAEQVRANRAG